MFKLIRRTKIINPKLLSDIRVGPRINPIVNRHGHSFRYSSNAPTTVKLCFDPIEAKSFTDIPFPKAIHQAIEYNLPEWVSPTPVQRKMLSVLMSNMSILTRSPAGTGKSSALALYALSQERNPHGGTTTLILVPHIMLGIQYYDGIRNLIKGSFLNIDDVVQILHRSTPSNSDETTNSSDSTPSRDENEQISLLMNNPNPHIIISTPTRILDILSSSDRSLLPLYNVSTIIVDEADTLVTDIPLYEAYKLKKDVGEPKTSSASASTNEHEKPAIILIKHLVSWRNAQQSQHQDSVFAPIKYALVSTTANKKIKASFQNSSLTQNRPIINIGFPSPLNRIPDYVDINVVDYDQTTGMLKDFQFPIYSNESKTNKNSDDNENQSLTSNNEYVFINKKDYIFNNDELNRTKERRFLEKSIIKSINTQKDYFRGFSSLYKSQGMPRSLLIVPNGLSNSIIKKRLLENGIKGSELNFDLYSRDVTIDDGKSKPAKINVGDFFAGGMKENEGSLTDFTTSLPNLLFVRYFQLPGMDLPSLSNVYVLGMDCILKSSYLQVICGRCRVSDSNAHNRKDSEFIYNDDITFDSDKWKIPISKEIKEVEIPVERKNDTKTVENEKIGKEVKKEDPIYDEDSIDYDEIVFTKETEDKHKRATVNIITVQSDMDKQSIEYFQSILLKSCAFPLGKIKNKIDPIRKP